jgi:hypothetical protein
MDARVKPGHDEVAAADLAKWDRRSLECGLGEKGKARAT